MKFCICAISENHEKYIAKFCETVKDADIVVIVDSGSTDKTIEIAKNCGANIISEKTDKSAKNGKINIYDIYISPWRADTARNIALGLVPDDIDVCVSLNLDEFLVDGWRDIIEKEWILNETNLLQSLKIDNNGKQCEITRICSRFGWGWKGERKEYLAPDPRIEKNCICLNKFLIKQNEVNKLTKVNKSLSIVFIIPGGWEPWDGETYYTKGIGGSETFVIRFAEILAEKGYDIHVFCKCNKDKIYNGVNYVRISTYVQNISQNSYDICFINREPLYLPVTFPKIQNVYIILHDLSQKSKKIPSEGLQNIICLTEWHKSHVVEVHPNLKNLITISSHGVDNNSGGIKRKNSFIYSSFPNRGLIHLLHIFPKITKIMPDATLNIFCRFDLDYFIKNDMDEIKLLIDCQDNVTNHGWVTNLVLRAWWKISQFWLYPCTFKETCCITAMEAAASQTLAITTNLAGLKDTVGDRGYMIDGDPKSDRWETEILNLITSFTLPNKQNEINQRINKNYEWSLKHSYENVVTNFEKNYILKHIKESVPEKVTSSPTSTQSPSGMGEKLSPLEKVEELDPCGMYNWTHDIPSGSKIIFETVLNNVKAGGKLLEIGAFAGTSSIGISSRVKNNELTIIDIWKMEDRDINLCCKIAGKQFNMDDVKKIFYNNLKISNIEARIIEKPSSLALRELLRTNEEFDFIYIDGSHTTLDAFSDIVMSWEILVNGGILAIDDYLWGGEDRLDIPKFAVDKFLIDYDGEYLIINKGYRIFLRKNIKCIDTKILRTLPRWWPPEPQIIESLCKYYENAERVLEVGPGSLPLPIATHFVDHIAERPNTYKLDINKDKLPFSDEYFDFVYCRHTLEDIFNPEFAFNEIKRVSKAMFIETPSPMAEMTRGIDATPLYRNGVASRGYIHHRYMLWNKDGVLQMLPKLPYVEYINYNDSHYNKIISTHPQSWNTYYFSMDSRKSKCKMLTAAIDYNIFKEYGKMINEGLNYTIKSIHSIISNNGVVSN